jgi:hypothetical protein
MLPADLRAVRPPHGLSSQPRWHAVIPSSPSPNVPVHRSATKEIDVSPPKSRPFRSRTPSKEYPFSLQHFTHFCRALFLKSENQVLHFQARAHDFVEMGGAPFSKK